MTEHRKKKKNHHTTKKRKEKPQKWGYDAHASWKGEKVFLESGGLEGRLWKWPPPTEKGKRVARVNSGTVPERSP